MIELIEIENPIAEKALALSNDEVSIYIALLSNGQIAHFRVEGNKLPDTIDSKDIVEFLIINK